MPGFISWGSSGPSPKKHHDGDELFCGSPAVFSSTLRQAARVVSATWFASDCTDGPSRPSACSINAVMFRSTA